MNCERSEYSSSVHPDRRRSFEIVCVPLVVRTHTTTEYQGDRFRAVPIDVS